MGAMNAICKLTVPLNDAENTALREALGVDKDMVVSAEKLQAWVGTGTIMQVLLLWLSQPLTPVGLTVS